MRIDFWVWKTQNDEIFIEWYNVTDWCYALQLCYAVNFLYLVTSSQTALVQHNNITLRRYVICLYSPLQIAQPSGHIICKNSYFYVPKYSSSEALPAPEILSKFGSKTTENTLLDLGLVGSEFWGSRKIFHIRNFRSDTAREYFV